MDVAPLSQRVAAPDRVERPSSDGGLVWRAATLDDVTGIQRCEVQIAAVDHPHYVTSVEELEDDFGHSFVDVERDTTVVLEGDEVVAWGLVLELPGQETLVRVILVGGVLPSHRGRGIGRRLLEWQERRGLERLAASSKTLPGWLVVSAEEGMADASALVLRRGFTPARYFLELSRDLSEPVPDVEVDAVIEPFTMERSEAIRAARNDAFRDHWGSQPITVEQWDSFVGRSTFRPDLCSIALRGDEVAGFVLAMVNEEDWPGLGASFAYIDLVGVPRAWRGRRLAPALLANSLRRMAEAGLECALLDVDSDSPTGAVGLYSGVGFAESNRSTTYTRVY